MVRILLQNDRDTLGKNLTNWHKNLFKNADSAQRLESRKLLIDIASNIKWEIPINSRS